MPTRPPCLALPLRLLLRGLCRPAHPPCAATGARARALGCPHRRSGLPLRHAGQSRLAMGPACDLLGPHRASGFASLLAALAVAATASSPAGFVALCFVACLSLANCVANQHWMSGIFVPSAVGLANAVTAGWANVGSTAAQLVMPLVYKLVLRFDVPITVAWRVTYLLPCVLLITTGLAVITFPYDLPRDAGVGGGAKTGKSLWKVVRGGVGNYRA
uniref:High-affinity nitrate transporter 2.4 n=2 Tax=Zea mays TaxID=4577 RepID=A0A804UIT6_MAIZE